MSLFFYSYALLLIGLLVGAALNDKLANDSHFPFSFKSYKRSKLLAGWLIIGDIMIVPIVLVIILIKIIFPGLEYSKK